VCLWLDGVKTICTDNGGWGDNLRDGELIKYEHDQNGALFNQQVQKVELLWPDMTTGGMADNMPQINEIIFLS